MQKYLEKKKELQEKYKDIQSSYEWSFINKHELFNDLNELLDLYAETDKCKRKIEKYIKEQTKDYVDVRSLALGDNNIFEFKNSEYLREV